MSSNILLVVLVGIAGGLAVGVQGPLSSIITQRLGSLESVFIIHAGGALAALFLLLPGKGGNLSSWQAVPWYALAAGVLGVVVISSMGFMIPRVGVLAATILLISGQLVMGSILDHFGMLGAAVRPFDLTRLLGLAAIFLGVWLTVRN